MLILITIGTRFVGELVQGLIDLITMPASQRPRVDCSVFTLTELGPKEAEMRIIRCDLHCFRGSAARISPG